MAVDSYTGVHGTMEKDGTPVAVSEFDVKVTRGVASAKRANKWSDFKKPGKIDITGSIKSIMTDGTMLGYLFNSTPTTGSAGTLHAGLTYPTAGTGENIADMTTPTIAAPSQIKLTALTGAITTAGQAIIYGTMDGTTKTVEIVEIPALGIGASVSSAKTFKTVTQVALIGVNSATGTLKVESVAGSSVVTVGAPAVFTLTGKATQGASHIYVNLPGAFFTEGGFNFTDADEIIMNSNSFTVQDADLCTIESV